MHDFERNRNRPQRRRRLLPGTVMALLLAVAAGTVAAQPDALVLARDGGTAYRIAVTPTASKTERYAAEELAGYLERITGARFPVVEGADGAERVIRIRRDGSTDLGADGFALRTDGRSLEIVGGGPGGALYGVYHLLETYLGVRWYSPEHTVVPERETVRLPPVDERQTPRFEYREVFTRSADDPAFSARLRLNGRFGHRIGGTPERLSPAFHPVRKLHIFDLVPPEEYRDDHPEFFGGGQLRFANPQVQRIAVDAAAEAVERWSGDGPYSLMIEHADRATYYRGGRDGALIERHQAPSAAYLDFVGRIAEAVGKRDRDVTVLAQAYLWSRKPPTGMELPGNMGVLFSDIERDQRRALDAEANAAVLEDLRAWGGLTDHVVVWTYHTNFAGYLQPYPDLGALGADLEVMAGETGIQGLFSQGAYNTRGGELAELRAWLLAHLLWDPERDVAALREDFLNGYYGQAAPFIADYIDLLHRTADAAGARLGVRVPLSADYLTADMLRRADELFTRAEQAVAGNPVHRRHVRAARMPVDYAILGTRPAAEAASWVRHEERLQRLGEYMELAGMTAYREGRGNPPEELLGALAIERRSASAPEVCSDRPADACRSTQELGFDLAGGARIVADPAASDGATAVQPGDRRAWGIQLPLDRLLPAWGEWRLYAAVRVESEADDPEETLLGAGVYPGRKRSVSGGDLAGDRYRMVELPGLWSGSGERYVWIAPAAGEVAEAVYVDRIVAVRGDEQ